MKALVLHDSPIAQARIGVELMGKGFQVVTMGDQATALEWMNRDIVDVLVMDEYVGSVLTHAIALSAERCNPFVSVVMLAHRTSAEAEDLYLKIPCLYCILGRETPTPMIAQMAMASVVNVTDAEDRVLYRKLWVSGQVDADQASEDLRPARDIASDLELKIAAAPPWSASPASWAADIPPPLYRDDFADLSVRVPGFFAREPGLSRAQPGVTATGLARWDDDSPADGYLTGLQERRITLV